MPAGARNHHWTKNIIASPDGSKLYIAIGSNSNVAEHGIDEEEGRAEIWELDLGTGRIASSPPDCAIRWAWHGTPDTGMLWVAVNERDELGNDLVPDYMTSVRDGGFYGWPYSYYGTARRRPRRSRSGPTWWPRPSSRTTRWARIRRRSGLARSAANTLSPQFAQGMFVGQHGSWNRKPRAGYKVIFVPFSGGKPSGMPIDVLTGFVQENGDAMGRPVGVAVDPRGGLLVADDVGNAVWRVTGAGTVRMTSR